MALLLREQTAQEFAAKFWKRFDSAFKSNQKLMYHYMVWWIWNQIQIGNLTSDQVRISYNNYFNKNLNNTQWNNLVTNTFIPIKDRYLAFLSQGMV